MLLLFAHCMDNDLDLNEKYVRVEGIQINKDAISIVSEGERLLLANVLPGQATNQDVIWSSDDPLVAEVDENGMVKAVATFSTSLDAPKVAVVTVRSAEGNFEATCEVTVTPNAVIVRDPNKYEVTDITLPNSPTPRSYRFSAEVIAPGTVSQDVVWESENDAVFTVNSEGVLTPVADGETWLNVSSAIVPAVTARIAVEVKEVQVQAVILEEADQDMLLSVNVLWEDHPTQMQRTNFYTFTGFLNYLGAAQDRHLFLMKERPEQVREIVVKFIPSLPSNTDVIWSYEQQQNAKWVALGSDDETDMPLKRPVPKMKDGQQVFTPEGNPVFLMTIPSGQHLLPYNPDKPFAGPDPDWESNPDKRPRSAWDVWDPDDVSGEKLCYVTFRATSADNPDAFAEGRLEVADYGRSVGGIVNQVIGTSGSPGHIVHNQTVNASAHINWNDFVVEQLQIEIDGAWVDIPYYHTGVTAANSTPVTLRKGNLYTVKWKHAGRYMCPWVAPQRHGSESNYGIIHKGLYDPAKPLGVQDCDYSSSNGGWMHETFQIWVKNSVTGPQQITLRMPRLNSVDAGTRVDRENNTNPLQPSDECLTEFYKDPDIFPYFTTSKNCAGDWLRFFVNLEN